MRSSFKPLPRNSDAWEPLNNLATTRTTTAPDAMLAAPTPLTPLTPLSQLSELGSPTPQSPSTPSVPVLQAELRVLSTQSSNVSSSAVVIIAAYDSWHPNNTRFVSPRNRDDNVRWTQNQRSLAKEAVTPQSIDELGTLVSRHQRPRNPKMLNYVNTYSLVDSYGLSTLTA